MNKETCIVKKTLWGNTDNVYKPETEYTFNSIGEAMNKIREIKDCQFGYMHRVKLTCIIDDAGGPELINI
jgi:hypothetical protein